MKRYSDYTDLPVIDAHVHVFPVKLYQAVKTWFKTHAWIFHEEGSAEDFIERQFSRGAAGLALLPYAHRPGVAKALNEFVDDLVRRFPKTAALAAVHPQDDDPRGLLKRAFTEQGLAGVKFHCHVTGIAPDDPAMFPIYESVIEHDKVLVIHAGREPSISAYGMDVHAVSGAARVKNALMRYPEMKIVVPHLGYDETATFCQLLDEFENLYLDTAMVITDYLPHKLDSALLSRYENRILYGTDYPHIPYSWETELKGVLAFNLGERANRNILHNNAARLFGLG